MSRLDDMVLALLLCACAAAMVMASPGLGMAAVGGATLVLVRYWYSGR